MANLLKILKTSNKRAKKKKIFFVFSGILFIIFLSPLVSKSSGIPLSLNQINLYDGKWFIKGSMQEGLTIQTVPNISPSQQFIVLLLNSTSLILVMFSYALQFFDEFYFEDIIMRNAKTFPLVFPCSMSFHPAFLFIMNVITKYSPSIPMIICSYFLGKYVMRPFI